MPYRRRVQIQIVLGIRRTLRERGNRVHLRDEPIDVPFAIEHAARPGGREIPPLREIPCGTPEPFDRAILPRTRGTAEGHGVRPPKGAAEGLRRRGELLLQPSAKRLLEQTLRLRLRQHREQRIDTRFHRPFAEQLGAESVNRADVRLFQACQRAIEQLPCVVVGRPATLALERFPQAQLQLAGRLFSERHRDDLRDARPAGPEYPQDPLHQLRGLAGTRGRLDDERIVERVGDGIARRLIGQGAHGISLSARRSPSLS
jgi:hypothetical protein